MTGNASTSFLTSNFPSDLPFDLCNSTRTYSDNGPMTKADFNSIMNKLHGMEASLGAKLDQVLMQLYFARNTTQSVPLVMSSSSSRDKSSTSTKKKMSKSIPKEKVKAHIKKAVDEPQDFKGAPAADVLKLRFCCGQNKEDCPIMKNLKRLEAKYPGQKITPFIVAKEKISCKLPGCCHSIFSLTIEETKRKCLEALKEDEGRYKDCRIDWNGNYDDVLSGSNKHSMRMHLGRCHPCIDQDKAFAVCKNQRPNRKMS